MRGRTKEEIMKRRMTERKYLAAANWKLGFSWELVEYKRITSSGAPTFSLFLFFKNNFGFPEISHAWPVHIDQPRHVLRKLAGDVSKRGLIALTDPVHETYTSRVRREGYGWETVGLREALVYTEPQLQSVIDSEPEVSDEPQRKMEDGPEIIMIKTA